MEVMMGPEIILVVILISVTATHELLKDTYISDPFKTISRSQTRWLYDVW